MTSIENMDTATHQKITDKIKQLPDFLIEELSDYVDFLLFKNEKDWYENLNPNQKQSIKQGLQDIENGNTHSHQSVMDEMAAYIKSKKK